MNLLDEILKKENEIFQRSSGREKLFYAFLTGRKESGIPNIPDGEIDKVCYSAFSENQIDVSKEIQRSLNTAPVRGLHFSNNLISLVGFSLKSDEAKNKYLREYFNSTGLSHQFIINRIFNELALPNNPKIASEFDSLVSEVFINKHYTNVESLLFKSYEKANDLIELFIVREAYQEILKFHPNTETAKLLSELAASTQKVIDASKRRIDSYVNVVILIIAFALIIGLPYLIKTKWDAWGLEPYITGIQTMIGIISFFLMALFNSNPDWFKAVQNFKGWLLRRSFERKDVDLARLKEVISKSNLEVFPNKTLKTNFFLKLNWKVILGGVSIFIVIASYWYFDFGHEPVEKIDILIGNNYDFAEKLYFHSAPDENYTFKLKDAKGEFRGVLQTHASILKDSTLHEYTWKFGRYNITIWSGKTDKMDQQVLDAIRWRKNVQF